MNSFHWRNMILSFVSSVERIGVGACVPDEQAKIPLIVYEFESRPLW